MLLILVVVVLITVFIFLDSPWCSGGSSTSGKHCRKRIALGRTSKPLFIILSILEATKSILKAVGQRPNVQSLLAHAFSTHSSTAWQDKCVLPRPHWCPPSLFPRDSPWQSCSLQSQSPLGVQPALRPALELVYFFPLGKNIHKLTQMCNVNHRT